jgi:hypothetical protein
LEIAMQRLMIVAGVLLTASTASAQSAASKVAGKYGWHTSWETARAEAQRAGKPLFVVFRCDP